MSFKSACFAIFLMFICSDYGFTAETIIERRKPIVISKTGRQAEVAVYKERVCVVYGDEQSVFYSTSTDGGNTFNEPRKLEGADKMIYGWRAGPQVAITEKYLTIAGSIRRAGMMSAWRSSDFGESWEGPFNMNDTKGVGEGMSGLSAGENGQLYSVWIGAVEVDNEIKRATIVGALSEDGGKTWSKNTLVYASPGGGVCGCCRPTVRYGEGENLWAIWRNNINNNRDMYVIESSDNGKTFGKAKMLGNKHYFFKGCPANGGDVVFDRKSEELAAIWILGPDPAVFLTRGKTEIKINEGGTQSRLAYGPEGLYLAWHDFKQEILYLLTPGSRRPIRFAKSIYPTIASSIDGEGPVIAAWERTEEKIGRGKGSGIELLRLDSSN